MRLGQAGVADGFRQRNVFPLPEISSGGGGGPSNDFWRSLANQGIRTLNEISEGINSTCESRKKLTRVQRRVQSNILEAYKDAYPEGCPGDCTDGLQSLCSSFRLYGSERADIKPYAKENISWPQASSKPVPLDRCLADGDREWLGTWQRHMLKQGGCTNVEPVVPYIDPVLKHNPVEYAGFLHELYSRSMIKFRVANGEKGKLGVFFVTKKSGQLRLIFDTRLLNQSFTDPPSTDLPSADAFTRLEMPHDQGFYIGSGDLSNAFYTLEVPAGLGEMFTMPHVEAGRMGISSIDGHPVRPGTQLLPYLTVLPMGWSWALHICQMVLMNGIRVAGFDEQSIIGHQRSSVILRDRSDVAVAGYVDNFGLFGCDRTAVDSGRRAIAGTLRGWGLTVHEEEEAQSSGDFVGLHFDGVKGHVAVKSSRIVKLKAGIDDLLKKQFCSGHTLQLVLGHCTWAMMCRRESLSLLHHCYQFCHAHHKKPTRLWPSVQQELRWVSSILPLLRCKINVGWGPNITASDSSPWGVGVCERTLDEATIRSVGSVSERWRFKFEDAVCARKHALASADLHREPGRDVLQNNQGCVSLHSDDDLAGSDHDKSVGFGIHPNFNSASVSGASRSTSKVTASVSVGTGDCLEPLHNDSSSCHIPLHDEPCSSFSSFITDLGFDEVPLELLSRDDWRVVWSKPWKYEANILNTEARALGWSVEHLLRSNRNIGKKLLCLSDNLPLVLGANKGRAKSGHLLKPLRKISALLLATGSRLAVRWVASELNVADAPSRAIAQWRAQGLERWWDGYSRDVDDHGGPTRSHSSKFISRSGQPKIVPTVESEGPHVYSSRVDIPGDTECSAKDSERLSSSVATIRDMVDLSSTDSDHRAGLRHVLSGVSQRAVRKGGGNRYGNPHSSGPQIFPPHVGTTIIGDSASDSSSSEGVGLCRSSPTAVAIASGSPGGHAGRDDQGGEVRDITSVVHPISHIPTSWGAFESEGQAVGPPSDSNRPAVRDMGNFTASYRGHDPGKDRDVRCNSHAGLGPLAEPISSGSHCGKESRRLSLESPPCNHDQRLQHGHPSVGVRPPRFLSVHTSPRRSHPRHSDPKTKHVGSEAERKVEFRCLSSSVREAGTAATRAVKDPVSAAAIWHGHHLQPTKSPVSNAEVTRSEVWNPIVTRRMFQKAAAKPKLRSLNGAGLLKQMFRDSVKKSRHHRSRVFLDLFCGHRGISKYLSRWGHGVVSIDTCVNPRLDLCDREVQQVILGWLKSRCVCGVWLATPCTTWSKARHGPVGSSWGPLRTNDHLWGIPGLNSHDKQKIQMGNATMRFTCLVISLCIKFSIPCFLENPHSSLMWLVPRLVRVCGFDCSTKFVTDFCQHGARWRKRTRIQAWFGHDCPDLNKRCCGHKGICSATSKPHIVLTGQDPVTKQLWTHLAQPYPVKFSFAGATALQKAAENMTQFQLRTYFGN